MESFSRNASVAASAWERLTRAVRPCSGAHPRLKPPPVRQRRQRRPRRDGAGAGGGSADPQPFERGRVNHTGDRHRIDDEPDIDGEFAIVAQKFARPIDGIDQDEGALRNLGLPSRRRFLREHRKIRQTCGQAASNDGFGSLVGIAHGAAIRFVPCMAVGGIDGHHRDGGLQHDFGENVRDCIAIDHLVVSRKRPSVFGGCSIYRSQAEIPSL